MNSISVIIPARNERERIVQVIEKARRYADEVIVIDDASTDETGQSAKEFGAKVIRNEQKKGYIEAIKTGFQKAKGDIFITIDADGEHNPADIPRLIKPISDGKAEVVLGRRQQKVRESERFIDWLVSLKMKVSDSCTGFRALKRDLALKLKLKGQCTCGILVLEAVYNGARVIEVPIETIQINKRRQIAWYHLKQVFHILGWLLKRKPKQFTSSKSSEP
jgi:glycosyltransferase involved in cell wall biosynthesis